MGLAGRKQKQRIPADPRNLSWVDDASRFGLSYLSKFGWDASQGLGSSGAGMKTHLKVQQKLDMMGIGAQHQRDPSGIAWKQNKEFEALLKRLNESAEQQKGADGEDTQGGSGSEHEMGRKTFMSAQEEKVEESSRHESHVSTVKKRKRKNRDDSDAGGNGRKKQKKEKEKHLRSGLIPTVVSIDQDPQSAPSSSGSHSEPIPKPRPMAHRARIRAAKRIAGKSESAISEILGIVPSSCVSKSTSTSAPTPPSPSTSVSQSSLLSLDNLTTSTKSVADYFKEKFLARTTASSPSSSSAPSGSATPGLGASSLGTGLSNTDAPPPDDEGGPPRRGIGSQVPTIPTSSQVPKSGSTSASGAEGSNADSRDTLTEKLRQKAERKAEKRKWREIHAKQPVPENAPSIVKEQVEEDDAENIRRASKVKKLTQSQERKQQAPVGDQSNLNDDPVTEKSHEHDTLGNSFKKLNKISKKEHKKKPS